MNKTINNLFLVFCTFVILISFHSNAQKPDLRVELYNLKEEVKKLQIENVRISNELSTSNSKNEFRIVDLGAKIEDLSFEISVLKRVIEKYKNGEIGSNLQKSNMSTPQNSSQTEENISEKNENIQKKQYSTQCSATTKKGTRCSRSARSNGLCWQHGG